MKSKNFPTIKFQKLLSEPLRNGIYKKKEFHGSGSKIVNMGELFAYPRLKSKIQMKRVELNANEKAKSTLQSGDLIFARRSLTAEGAGKCSIVLSVDEETTFESSIIRARLNTEIANPEFYYYFFNSIYGKLALGTILRQVAVAGITGSDLALLDVPNPPKSIQDKISEISKYFDEKIELNTQTNQTLESIAQAIFKSWFVDFEPVKAKMTVLTEGGTHAQAELAAMSAISGKNEAELAQIQQQNPEHYQQLAETAALFPSAMMDSELGEIPEGWEVALLCSKIDVLNGFAFKSEDYAEQGTFVLRTKNFSNGIAEPLHDDVYLPPEFLASHAKYLCEPFDYHLIMVGASVGNRGIIFPELLPALRNQNMWCFRPKKGSNISKAQSKLLLDRLISSVSGLASGSAREFFRKGDFENQKICFGSESITESFEELASPLYEKQSAIFSENIRLTQLRDSLLPKLLSGEIDLSDIQSEVA